MYKTNFTIILEYRIRSQASTYNIGMNVDRIINYNKYNVKRCEAENFDYKISSAFCS
jgi:hypothetical protein